jgi:DeoR family glycerol-3-phosphate regulon repressor
MFTTRRQSEILKTVQNLGSCSIAELASSIGVSDETIRRNLKPLSDNGLVLRVHGGVTLPDMLHEAPFQKRIQENSEAKRQIAKIVAKEIQDGDTIILDCGSTTTFVARALRDRKNLIVVTNSAEVARTLATNESNRVFMAGGELRSDDTASLGPSALQFVRQFKVRHAIITVGGISKDGSLMVFHPEEAEFSRVIISCAENVIVAADHSKFQGQGLVRICGPASVDMLVTDKPVPANILQKMQLENLEIKIA